MRSLIPKNVNDLALLHQNHISYCLLRYFYTYSGSFTKPDPYNLWVIYKINALQPIDHLRNQHITIDWSFTNKNLTTAVLFAILHLSLLGHLQNQLLTTDMAFTDFQPYRPKRNSSKAKCTMQINT